MAPGDMVRVGGNVFIYGQWDAAAVAPAVGNAGFLKSVATFNTNAANPICVFTNYAGALGTGSANTVVPLGVVLNVVTPGNYGYFQAYGFCPSINFGAAATVGHYFTPSAGDPWSDAGVAAAPISGSFGKVLATIASAGLAAGIISIGWWG
jgi:hypothetical protein